MSREEQSSQVRKRIQIPEGEQFKSKSHPGQREEGEKRKERIFFFLKENT